MEKYTYLKRNNYIMYNILSRYNEYIVNKYAFSVNKQHKLHSLINNINNTKNDVNINAKCYIVLKYLKFSLAKDLIKSYEANYIASLFNTSYYNNTVNANSLIKTVDVLTYNVNMLSYYCEKYLEHLYSVYKTSTKFNIDIIELLICFNELDTKTCSIYTNSKLETITPDYLLNNTIINNYLKCTKNDKLHFIDNIEQLKGNDNYTLEHTDNFIKYIKSERFINGYYSMADIIFKNDYNSSNTNNNDNTNNDYNESSYDNYEYSSLDNHDENDDNYEYTTLDNLNENEYENDDYDYYDNNSHSNDNKHDLSDIE
jgi:hypothetical protein